MAVHSPATWDSSGAMCFLGWVGVGSRVSASLNLTNGGGSWVSASLNMTEWGGKFKIGDMVDKIMAVSSK